MCERRRWFAALLLAALIVPPGLPSLSAAGPVDLPGFISELDRLVAAIPDTTPAELTALRDAIPAAWTVRTPDGDVEVTAVWLRRSIEEARRDPSTWPARRSDIVSRLTALRREAASLQVRSGRSDAGGASATLTAVLAQKEFQRSASAGAMARLRRFIADWLVRLWQQLGGERLGRRNTAIVLAWAAGLGALLALTWWIVRALVRTRDQGRLALTPPPAARRSARAWALQAAAAQDMREAVRCAYRAAVVRLEEEGAWRVDDTRTPREHLRLLPSTHGRRRLFADVTRRFEEVWFGARAATADDGREMLTRLRELGCLPAD